MAKTDPFKLFYDPSVLISVYREIRNLIEGECRQAVVRNTRKRMEEGVAPNNLMQIASYLDFAAILGTLSENGRLKPALDTIPNVLAESFNSRGKSRLLQTAHDETTPAIARNPSSQAYMRLRALDNVGQLLAAFKANVAPKFPAEELPSAFSVLDHMIESRRQLIEKEHPRLTVTPQDFDIG